MASSEMVEWELTWRLAGHRPADQGDLLVFFDRLRLRNNLIAAVETIRR